MIAKLILFILTFVSLNCENLFDCADDPLTDDDAFTPAGQYRWTDSRYWSKVNNIARELLACGDDGTTQSIPDLIALTEVENDSVLTALTRHSLLRNAGYEYIITHSADVRGMNVALLYSPLTFAVISSYPLRVTPLRQMRPTRDILYVKGRTAHNDTLHIFVVHAPSRLGGEQLTRSHRQAVCSRLAASLDSLQHLSPTAHIIIAGDFNDTPTSPALAAITARGMENISATAQGTHGAKSTYKYQGEWEQIDHIFVSRSLAATATCSINDGGDLLTDDEEYGALRPNRNFYRVRWRNGYSDHLPLVAHIRLHE